MNLEQTIVFQNGWIARHLPEGVQVFFGDIIVRNGQVLALKQKNRAEINDSLPDTSEANMQFINLGDRLVTPPLVNFHDHIYSRLAKGLPVSGPLDSFIHILENLWWRLDATLDEQMVEASARLAALESIRWGVTTIFDHHAAPQVTERSLPILADVLQEYDLRGVLCLEASDRHGSELARKTLKVNYDFIRNHTTPRVKAMLGLHAPFTLSEDTLNFAAQLLGELRTGIHIHVAEDAADVSICREKWGKSPLQRLATFNLLNDRSIVVHGVHLTPEDYEILANSGAALALNPDSNLNNAVGIATFSHIPEPVPILCGTDGMHANPARSLKQLFLLHRHQGHSFEKSFSWVQRIYRDQWQFVRRYFPDLPTLSEGEPAELIVWEYIPPTPLNDDNFWGHYLYGALETPVRTVFQHGKFLMHDFILQVDNYEQRLDEIYRAGEKLFQQFNK